ncbi:MAG: MFS transporter [Sphingomonadales bacterium]|nr:MFS transporter [Sphingomonadales bacterium]
MTERNQPRVIRAWCMYDWANSAYNLCITSAIFPVYYSSVTKAAVLKSGIGLDGTSTEDAPVRLAGMELPASVAFSYALSAAYLLIVIISPFLGGQADYGGLKKRMMALFAGLGSISCMALFFFTDEYVAPGLILFMLAAVGWAGASIFYNAFLPEIATPDRFDQVSAQGFSYGYIGSVTLLLLNLVMIMFPGLLFDVGGMAQLLQDNNGMDQEAALEQAQSHYKSLATRWSFVAVGVWWMGFAFYTLKHLPPETTLGQGRGVSLWSRGYDEFCRVWKRVRLMPTLLRYLLAYFFTSCGLQTIMVLATIFASKELEMGSEELIATVLLIQLIAIAGAHAFSYGAWRMGNLPMLMWGILVWIGICLTAYLVSTSTQFYLLAAVVGIVMGGTQSLLRSTYAKLIPTDTRSHASFFSFYDVTEKLAIVFGTFAFGYINLITGSMRNSALMLSLFFMLGMMCMFGLLKRHKELGI